MNQSFKKFLEMPNQDRQDVFEDEANRLDTLPTYIEKDFWVCLTINILYNALPSDCPRLLFKGGTSLSKAYQLIERFSEDIDFTIFREDIGFEDSKDPALATNKRQKQLSGELKQAASDYICNKLKENLEKVAVTLSSECRVSLDSEDKERLTLLLHYPSLFMKDSGAYVQPHVKLEGGGRSALDPNELHTIKPFIANTLDDWNFAVPNVVTICPERTFWDKVMILHGWHCGYRDDINRLPTDRQRLSRHYYDVAMIYKAERGKAAVKDSNLREDVRLHTIKFFNRAWMKLEEAIPGSLRLVPEDKLLKTLQKDYQAMQGMMLGTGPDFKEILAVLSALESQINEPI